ALTTAGPPGSLFRGCSVVEDPDLTEVAQAHEYLIEIRVVGHSVEMRPVWIRALSRDCVEIKVDTFRMSCYVAVVRFLFVVVLDQVIPQVPFPNDFPAGLAQRLDLDEAVGLNLSAFHARRNSSCRDRLSRSLLLLDQHQNVSIGQPYKIVMLRLCGRAIGKIPNQFSVPVEFLHLAATTCRPPERWVRRQARTNQISVLEKIRETRWSGIRLPCLHYSAVHVDQKRGRRLQWRYKRVPHKRSGIVSDQAHSLSCRADRRRSSLRECGADRCQQHAPRNPENLTAFRFHRLDFAPCMHIQKCRI